MAKNAPTVQSENAQKVKMAKNRGKNYEKNRFSIQQLPKKGHFLKEMHHFFSFAFGEKKSQFFFRAFGARRF